MEDSLTVDWHRFKALQARDIVDAVRPGQTPQQKKDFLLNYDNNREALRLGGCAFGRRGRPALAVRSLCDEAQHLVQLATSLQPQTHRARTSQKDGTLQGAQTSEGSTPPVPALTKPH
ncbi:hypothetical protein PLESTF_000830500 [Pleodorina starrii]|nr:hypothetical protein PLESTF_000830500 [Pleodorina starrii]